MNIQTQAARNAAQIGAIIRRIRRAKGLTQAELGDRTGLRQATISRLEAGQPNMRLETLLDTLSVLGLEIAIRDRLNPSADEGSPALEDLF